MTLGDIVLAFPERTVDHRDAVGSRIGVQPTAEPARHSHQVGVMERLIGPGQRTPPQTEPAGIVSHSEVRIQYDPIDAIVAAAQ